MTTNESSSNKPEDPGDYEMEVTIPQWQRSIEWLRTRKGVVTLLVLALIVATACNRRALYERAKTWRARQLIARSVEAGRRGDETREFNLLREAFTLCPSTPPTLRAVARYHEKRGESSALAMYEQLLASKAANADDFVRACRLAYLSGRVEMGRKLLSQLREAEGTRGTPAVLSLEAQSHALDNSWDTALALARQAVAHPAASASERLVLANILVRASARADEKTRENVLAEAIDLLGNIVARGDEIALEALTTLVTIARDPSMRAALAARDVTPWIEAADRNPIATARLRIAAWDLQLASHSSDLEPVFSAFLDKWREAPTTTRIEAARWLNQRGKPNLSLELSTPEKDSSSDWLLVHLDALAATGRWDTVLERLQEESGQAAKMSGALRGLFTMRAKPELKQPFDAAEAWRDVQIQVQKEPFRDQLYVAQYAERVGQISQATAIYRRLLDQPAGDFAFGPSLTRDEKLACYTGMIRATPATAPAAELLPLFEGLSSEFPEMDEARNDAIYLRLLTGKSAETSRNDLAQLLTRNPSLLAYRTTMALLELRAGNNAAAAQLYDGWQIDWATAQDRFKAVRIAVLRADGKREAAEAMRPEVDPKKLRPEELALLNTPGV